MYLVKIPKALAGEWTVIRLECDYCSLKVRWLKEELTGLRKVST